MGEGRGRREMEEGWGDGGGRGATCKYNSIKII
jgi:hypothetical protein